MNRSKKILSAISVSIAFLAVIATLLGILSNHGPGEFIYESIRGQDVLIYGKGFYKHMSKEVAVQGIAQDYVTLFLAVPVLLLSLVYYRKGSLRAKYVLTGVLGYLMVTYIFYISLAMYNELFLLWAVLASLSFYGFIVALMSFRLKDISSHFSKSFPRIFLGYFLIINSIAIGLMWLSGIVPPLLSGKIYPDGLQHYTTLIVQGFDLSILLPASFISGYLLLKKRELGYLLAPPYIIFLTILMLALVGKIIAMSLVGASAGPALVIIPLIAAIAATTSFLTIKSVKK